jgi:peroxiredoxin
VSNLTSLPTNLPAPIDDGAAKHLIGLSLPAVTLPSTAGSFVAMNKLEGITVIYCYPMTGQPDVALPEGWDAIPGARGCTPQSCSYRDHYAELNALGAEVFGLSTQTTEYQKEMVGRLHLPFPVLSDHTLEFALALRLPTFQVNEMTLLQRLTLICNGNKIEHVNYPVFPSDADVDLVIDYLKSR